MAKQLIAYINPPMNLVNEETGQATADWRWAPQVIWERDQGFVQLGLVAEHDPDGMNEDSLYTGILDRTQINRLIATLRRARDAAYGKDE